MKRIISIIAFICLLVGMLPAGAFAEESGAGGGGSSLLNSIVPSAAEFDSSGIGDIAIKLGENSSRLLAVKNSSASLNSNDYSISGNTVTIKKSYLNYFFTKFNAPWVKLKLTFDFEDGNDPIFTVTRAAISNFIACNNPVFDSSNPQDITVNVTGAAIKAIKSGSASLNSNDCSISGNTVTIKKSYLNYFFTKFNAPWAKLNLVFDFESGNDPLFTVTPMPISNFIACNNPVFDSSNPQDITVNVTGAAIKAIKSGSASLNSNDYSISRNTVTIKKSYLNYFFTKFNAPWVKLNLTFDFESGNDPLFTVTPMPISNFITCESPVFDLSNPQDIKVNITGNTLNTIKSGSASLTSNDFSISGNTVTIKKSYLNYFFTKFNAPWAKLNLTFDFEKGNDPLFTVSRIQNTSSSTSFIGMVKAVKIEGQTVTLIKDVNGVSTEIEYPVETLSNDLKYDSETASTSAGAVNVPITWSNFAANDMQGCAGDKTSVTDSQHRIYKFYIDSDNKITGIERLNFGSNITPTEFNTDTDIIYTFNGHLYIDNTIFFDLKDNKVRYWKDIEGKPVSKVVLQASMKANGFDAAAVAFVNDTYKYIYDPSTFYSYIEDEVYCSPYYCLTTGTGDVLKLHKDDADEPNDTKTAMDKQFISYVKDLEKIKVKSVTKVVYSSAYTKGLTLADVVDEDTATTLVWGKFVSRDGRGIVVDVEGGNLAAGPSQTFVVDTACKTVKTRFKDTSVLDKDNTSLQSYTDLVTNDQVGLIIVDNLVKGIYFIR